MFCRNCGKEVPDASKFCPYCGTEREKAQAEQPPSAPPSPQLQQPSEQPQPFAPHLPGEPQSPQPQQQFYGQSPAVAPQAAPTKKGSKAPLIIIAAVVALLAIGGVVLAATGVFSSLFNNKNAVVAFYEGTENLFYDTSSATVEVRAGIDMTLKWDFGNDLAHSTIWGYSGGTGFVYAEDTLYVYRDGSTLSKSASSETAIVMETEDLIEEANAGFYEAYGIDVDLNKIVSNGKLDRAYIEELNRIIDEADLDSYEFETEDVETVKITEIINAFMTSEVSKKAVYETFMSDVEKTENGGVTKHEATIDPAAFFRALDDYASKRGKEADYVDAAEEIATLCDSASEIETLVKDFTIEITLEKNVLIGLDMTVNMPSGALSVTTEITNINKTDLSKDEKLQEILASPSSSDYGELFDSLL